MLTEPSKQALGAVDSSNRFQATLFGRACRQLDLAGDLEQALLLMPKGMTTSEMGADPRLAVAVAERARPDWDRAASAVQIQYVHFDDYDEPLVLYSKPLGNSLIILVASSGVLLSRLRRIADSLVHILSESEDRPITAKTFTIESFVRTDTGVEGAYAIVWRPVEPLSRAMRDIIRDSARQLARRKGCQLNFVGVASDHVHLVLQCPRRRKDSWAAQVFKSGIEEDIARRYGTSAILWQKGFLADSSSQPIGGETLLAYLSS